MRTVLISLAAAASALAFAAPAAAQYYPYPPQPQPYGYGYGYPQQPYGYNYGYGQQPYGYNYGYGYNNFNRVRALQARVDHIQRNLSHLARYRMISRNEFRNRNEDARDLERRLRRDVRDGRGFTAQEMFQMERRIANLEQRIARDVRDGRQWGYRW